MTEDQQDLRSGYGRAIAKAWTDADYKARLLSDPHAALAEIGVELPAGVSVTVSESTAKNPHLIIPPMPEGEISDEALQQAVGAGCACCNCSP